MDYRIPFDALPWEPCGPGARHKLHRRRGEVFRLVEYGADMPPHWCARGHVGTILSGRFEVEFDSGTCLFADGDGVDIPPGEAHRHRARVLTDKVLAFFIERDTDPASNSLASRGPTSW